MRRSEWADLDFTRIGQYLEAERGNRSRAEIAALAGVDEKSVYNAEAGRVPSRNFPKTYDTIARQAYGWKPGALLVVGRGGEPEKYDAPPSLPPAPMTVEQKLAAYAKLRAENLSATELRVRMELIESWPERDS